MDISGCRGKAGKWAVCNHPGTLELCPPEHQAYLDAALYAPDLGSPEGKVMPLSGMDD